MAYYQEGPGSNGPRKKSLLIGINYVESQHQLQGCHQDVLNMREFLTAMDYPSDSRSQVILWDDKHTDRRGPFWPNGHNSMIVRAFSHAHCSDSFSTCSDGCNAVARL